MEKIQIPRPLNLKKSNECMNCQRLIDEESSYQIALDTVIQAWDFDHISEDKYLAEYEIDKNEKLLKKQREEKQLNPNEKRKDANFNVYSITKNYQVPGVLRRVFPNLDHNELLKNRNSAIFTVQKITVCEECYLKVMDSAHFSQNTKNLAKYVIKSSQHNNDDLVPLKNDRIFFHKFKYYALQNQKKAELSILNGNGHNRSSSMFSKKNEMSIQRSKSISQLIPSSASLASGSHNHLDSSNSSVLKRNNNIYFQTPSTKNYQPLRFVDGGSSSGGGPRRSNGSISFQQDRMVSNQLSMNISPVKKDECVSVSAKSGSDAMDGEGEKQTRANITSLIKLKKKIFIQNYELSGKQFTKLVKSHPKEIQMLSTTAAAAATTTTAANGFRVSKRIAEQSLHQTSNMFKAQIPKLTTSSLHIS